MSRNDPGRDPAAEYLLAGAPVRFQLFKASHVRAVTHTAPGVLRDGQSVPKGLVAALASACVSNAIAVPPDASKRHTSEYTSNFFRHGRGDFLIADAHRVQANEAISTWRISVFRTQAAAEFVPEDQVAEILWTSDFVSRANPEPQNGAAKRQGAELTQRRALDAFLAGRSTESRGSAAEVTRRQIYRGACKVLLRKGFGDASIREIAAASGVPIATMYQYIGSKEDLLSVITSESMSEALDRFEKYLADLEDPKSVLENIIKEYVSYIGESRDYINLVYRETRALSREKRAQILALDNRFTSLWKDLIEEGVRKSQFAVDNVELAANIVYFFCHVWSLRYWNLQSVSETKIQNELVHFILRGLNARAGRGKIDARGR
jgi:AcrR family transcriptional regulator/acyl-coenzyme A thioesterase PaaI-like protein